MYEGLSWVDQLKSSPGPVLASALPGGPLMPYLPRCPNTLLTSPEYCNLAELEPLEALHSSTTSDALRMLLATLSRFLGASFGL
jgi:hypothetical protein